MKLACSFRALTKKAAQICVTILAGASAFAWGCGLVTQIPSNLKVAAREAVSENPQLASAAIGKLRAAGPSGLSELCAVHAGLIEKHAPSGALPPAVSSDPEWSRLKAALDEVGAQRDCYASKLYWFTDLDKAKAAAKASGKPILSLRLLGKLSEEFSCANSRFFRTTLYANAGVSSLLREHFILHWQSVRPVPRVTIDFGDGRKLESTITGNSIHYVLDENGAVIDALPGLYGAEAFRRNLQIAESVAAESRRLDATARIAALKEYHRERLAALLTSWQNDLGDRGRAIAVGPELATSRAGYEALAQMTDDLSWKRIALIHFEAQPFDASALQLIAAKRPFLTDSARGRGAGKAPTAIEASKVARTKAYVESPVLRAMSGLQETISEDTVRNEYLFHSKIHEWLLGSGMDDTLDKLNSKVYAGLFLTPESDPWLGLAPKPFSTSLEDDGVVTAVLKHQGVAGQNFPN